MSNDLVKCTKCKKDKEINCFMKKDKQLKNCDKCRERDVRYKNKSNCPCGKSIQHCKIHGGISLCPCGKSKQFCKIHGGISLCPCGKNKRICKIHGGNGLCPCGISKHQCKIHITVSICLCGKLKSVCNIHGGNALCPCGKSKNQCKIHNDSKRITINYMINGSKTRDKKLNLFDKNQFIDKQFLSNLLDLYKNCIYCNCELNLDKRNPQLATIERLDNSLGHIKRNCVIACFNCNVSRVGDKYN